MKRIGTPSFWKLGGSMAGLLLLLAILVAVNVIATNARVRKDLTQERLYTLSDGTRNILSKLKAPVTLKFFFNSSSPEVPVYLKAFARQVEDLLQEYRIAGGGRVTIETYDPKPDSDAEEWAQRYGLSAQNMGMFGPQMFLGLVAVSGSSEAVLPVLDPRTEGLLEYSITRLIHRVGNTAKPTIGVMSSLPVSGAAPNPMMGQRAPASRAWLAIQDLKDDYTVRDIPPAAETIEGDVDALIVIHPKELSDRTLYAIDQFVLRGGRLLAFVDPFCIVDAKASPAQQPFGMPSAASNLEKLFRAWGVSYDAGKVVADIKAATPLRTPDNRVEENPAFLSLNASHANVKDVLTSGLETFMMPFSGSLSAQSDSNRVVTALFSSSDTAGLVDAMTAQFGGSAVRRDFKTEPVPLNMALRLSGTFRTAFPDGQPKEEKPEAEAKPADAAAPGLKEGSSAVILVADVDMIADEFCVQELNFFGAKAHQPLNNNLAFFANAAEQMAGSSDLIGIRSRGRFARPFDRVLALEQKARRDWQDTEEKLTKELQQTREQLSQLQTQKDQSQQFILSAEQKKAIANFRQKEIEINRELKDVRKSLRKEIDTLGIKVKLINIVLMPVLVSLGGIAFAWYRRRKR